MDDLNLDVVINLAVNGLKGGDASQIRELTDAVDELNRAGKITPEAAEAASKGINRISRSSSTARTSTSQLAKAQMSARAEAETLASAQSKLASALENQRFESSISGADKMAQAQARLTRATEDRAKAQAQYDRASASGNIAAQTAATRALTGAVTEQTRAQQALSRATDNSTESINSLRYANYDMGRTLLTVSAGTAAIGIGLVSAAASYESAFASVERTSGAMGAELDGLRDELMALTREIPLTFEEVSSLAARGAQLGIATDSISEFTEVVAQFVATSDTVTLDQAVEAFGRISNLLGEKDFNALGSAITLVGVNAAATESQIIRTTQELAPFAAAAGMATGDTIGLAAALASLGQPPERVRSAFSKLSAVLDRALAGGSDKLSAFAQALGTTEQEAANLWKSDPGEFIQRLAQGLKGVDNLTVAFDALGIKNEYAKQVFKALAADARNAGDGISVLDQAMVDANAGFDEGTELQKQYAIILKTLESRWQILKNAFMEFAAAAGDTVVPVIKRIVDGLASMLQGAAAFARSPLGQALIPLIAGLGAFLAAWAALRGGIALASGALFGFQTVAQAGIGVGLISGLKGLAGAFLGVGAAAGTASGGVALFGKALKASGILAAILLIAALVTDLRGTVLSFIDVAQFIAEIPTGLLGPARLLVGIVSGIDAVLRSIFGVSNVVGGAIGQLAGFVQSAAKGVWDFITSIFTGIGNFVGSVVSGVRDAIQQVFPWLGDAIRAVSSFAQGAFKVLNAIFGVFGKGFAQGVSRVNAATQEAFAGLRRFASGLPSFTDSFDKMANAMSGAGGAGGDLNNELNDLGDNAGKGSDAADKLAKSLRTVLDYASDLSSVFSRAFELRFGVPASIDETTSKWITMRKEAEAAAKSIRDLEATIRGLKSDIKTDEYFLSIAVEYGDTARADLIRKRIAENQAKLVDSTKELREQQDLASKSTEGNSEGAIKNRKSLQDLVTSYQNQIEALAKAGASQKTLSKQTGTLKKDFIEQARAMGFSEKTIKTYASAFDDFGKIIAEVPRDVSPFLEIWGLGPAEAALREFAAKAEKTMADSGKAAGGGFASGFDDGFGGGAAGADDSYESLLGDMEKVGKDRGLKTGRSVSQAYNRGLLERLGDILRAGVEGIKSWVQGILSKIVLVSQAVARIVQEWVQGVLRNIILFYRAGESSVREFVAGIGTKIQDVVGAAGRIVKAFVDGVFALRNTLVNIGKTVVTHIIEGVSKTPLGTAVKSIIDRLVPGWGEQGKKIGKDLTGGIGGGIDPRVLQNEARTRIGQPMRDVPWKADYGKVIGARLASGVSDGITPGSMSSMARGRIGAPIRDVPWKADFGKVVGSRISSGLGDGFNINSIRDMARKRIGAPIRDVPWRTDFGRQVGSRLASGIGEGINGGSVASAVRWSFNSQLKDAGYWAGRDMGNALAAGLQSIFSGGGVANNAVKNALPRGQRWMGGFAGKGGKYQPMGVYHGGEYIIPKQDVNQSTGLPYPDALGRLMGGLPGAYDASAARAAAPAASVRGVTDLSASTIQQLAQVMDKVLVVNGKVVAQTATDSNTFVNNGGGN